MDENILDENYLNDLPLWVDAEAQVRLEEVCAKHKIPVEVITELVMVQRERQHQERAHGINSRFEEILGVID
jgi:cytidylate kinase